MNKLNSKQVAWARKESRNYVKSKMKRLFLSVLFIFTAFAALSFALEPSETNFNDLLGTGGVTVATVMGAVGSIDLETNAKGAGKQVKAKLWLISEDQWDDSQSFPSKVDGARANIPLKNGEYWHYIKSVDNSPDLKSNSELGDIAATINNELSLGIRGINSTIRKLLEDGVGYGFFVVLEICSTGKKYLIGNSCKPAILTNFEGGPGKDHTGFTVSFKNECGEMFCEYTGNTPAQAAATVAEDATTIGLTSNPRYQLTDGSVSSVAITSFTGVTDADVGRIVTILGSGGTYPSTIPSGNDFMLIGGETWTALANREISFKIFKDGGASYIFVEVSGSRT